MPVLSANFLSPRWEITAEGGRGWKKAEDNGSYWQMPTWRKSGWGTHAAGRHWLDAFLRLIDARQVVWQDRARLAVPGTLRRNVTPLLPRKGEVHELAADAHPLIGRGLLRSRSGINEPAPNWQTADP